MTFFWNGNRSGVFDDKIETYYEVRHGCILKLVDNVLGNIKKEVF